MFLLHNWQWNELEILVKQLWLLLRPSKIPWLLGAISGPQTPGRSASACWAAFNSHCECIFHKFWPSPFQNFWICPWSNYLFCSVPCILWKILAVLWWGPIKWSCPGARRGLSSPLAISFHPLMLWHLSDSRQCLLVSINTLNNAVTSQV